MKKIIVTLFLVLSVTICKSNGFTKNEGILRIGVPTTSGVILYLKKTSYNRKNIQQLKNLKSVFLPTAIIAAGFNGFCSYINKASH